MAPAGAVALSIAVGANLRRRRAAAGRAACPGRVHARRVLLHLVVPVLGILVFIPAEFTDLGIGRSVFKFVAPLSYPSSDTGLVIGACFLIGVAVLLYLYARHPGRLPEMKRVFADEPLATAGKS
jgi:hypothetical protein